MLQFGMHVHLLTHAAEVFYRAGSLLLSFSVCFPLSSPRSFSFGLISEIYRQRRQTANGAISLVGTDDCCRLREKGMDQVSRGSLV